MELRRKLKQLERATDQLPEADAPETRAIRQLVKELPQSVLVLLADDPAISLADALDRLEGTDPEAARVLATKCGVEDYLT